MKEEKILDLLDGIDEKYILEVEKKRRRKQSNFVSKASLIAACICLLLLCSFIFELIGNNSITPEDTGTPTTEIAEEETTKKEDAPPISEESNEMKEDDLVEDNVISSSHPGGQIEIDKESVNYVVGTVEAFTKNGFEFKLKESGEIVTVIAKSTEGISVGDRLLIYYDIPNADSAKTIIAVNIVKKES